MQVNTLALINVNCVFSFLALSILTSPAGWSAPAQQAYLKASNTHFYDNFGNAVACSGNTVVVGARKANNYYGRAYVFARSGTNWGQQAFLLPNDPDSFSSYPEFGHSVSVSGDIAVVGAPHAAAWSGRAYVFVRMGTNWSQQAILKASNGNADDQFGWAVAISGNTIVVGSQWEDSSATGVNGNQSNNEATNSGAAYVFVRSGTNWSQQAYLKASNTAGGRYEGGLPITGDLFGSTVAISGDIIAVGAPYEDSKASGVNGNQNDNSVPYAGAAYVFVRTGTNWSQQAYLKASNTRIYHVFGISVGVSGDTVVVGAYGEDSGAIGVNGDQYDTNAPDSGAAYVFVRSGSNWNQQAYLKASNTAAGANARFGEFLAISGDTIIIGARQEQSSATGINGNQTNRSIAHAGAAYVFVRSRTNWSQQAYVKASNTEADDWFGGSVALSGDTAVVGAIGEASGATGVNGNQNDNSAGDSGAAYVFTGFGFGRAITIAPDALGGYILGFEGISGFTYQLQRAISISGPWTTNAIFSALSSGLIEVHDTNAPLGQAFYQVVQQ
jgi:hypothetical protein